MQTVLNSFIGAGLAIFQMTFGRPKELLRNSSVEITCYSGCGRAIRRSYTMARKQQQKCRYINDGGLIISITIIYTLIKWQLCLNTLNNKNNNNDKNNNNTNKKAHLKIFLNSFDFDNSIGHMYYVINVNI